VFKNWLKLTKNRNILTIIISFFILFSLFVLSRQDIPYFVNKNVQNLHFMTNDIRASKEIIVVEIDEETLSWRKNRNGEVTLEWLWRFPFDRKAYAQVIDNLKDAWAAIIALDVIFWERSNEESDNVLANSIKNAWNVVLWLWPDSNWRLNKPYKIFNDYAYTTGYLSTNIDSKTWDVYWILPFAKFLWETKIYDHFTVAILRWYYSYMYNDEDILWLWVISNAEKFSIWKKIELIKSKNNSNEVLINYSYDSDANRIKIRNISFLDIYNNKFKKEVFKDKIILVWATAKWIKDIFYTPIWQQYWVYLHANFINTIITENWIKYLNPYLEFLIIFLIILISVYFNLSTSWKVLFFSNLALIWLSILFVIYITLYTGYLPSYSLELWVWIVVSLAFSNIIKYLIENRHKNKLNKALSEYVSKDIAHEILSGEWKINLNWENKDIAIFFSDIEWFTSISEKFTPEDLVWFLREYLSEMSNIILDEKWFINKYEWDAIMALWWVFWDVKDISYYMCLSAVKQQQVLKKLNINWKERWFSEIKARIGMHYWSAIIWNIWAEWRKMEFTALWDSVNLASRLEWVNKMYWTYMCASEDIYNIEKNNFEFRYLDKIRVKWKQVAVNIYELVSISGELTEKQTKIFNKFDEAIGLYKDIKFKEALAIFTELSKLWDKPSFTYKERCEIYIKNSPWSNWDWVWIMTTK